MKKRKLFLGVLLASALIGVAACNNNNNNGDNTDDKSSETQVTKYTVTFDVNGGTGTVAPQEVEENSKATRPTSNPTKAATAAESYTFAGWYTDAAGTTAFNFDTAITGDITLYAKYTSSPVQYTVTFESNGGSAVQSATVNYNGTVTKPTDPSKDPVGNVKYAFGGWYKEAALTNEFDFANDKITAATTLYAKWTETEKVSVIFNSKGGSAVDTQLVFPGETATEPTAPTKTSDDEYKYSFEGWYTDENCTQAFSFSTVIEGNLTLYANWTATPVTKYTVQFDTKGGSAVDSVQVIEGRTVSKPSTNPTKESDMDYIYTFKNWYKDEACTTVFDFANETIEENTTIYAGWTQATRSWFALNVNSDNVTKEIEIGNKLDLAGLVVSAVDNKGTQTLSDSDYTVTVTDQNGTAFDINDDTATAGNYTVKVTFKSFNKTFTIEAKQPQYKFSFKLTAHDYNQSLETPHTGEYLFPAGTTTLFDNKSFTIAMTGVTSDNNQAKFQLGNDRELDGVTYTDRIQIHKSKGQMTITAKKSGTVILYATVGANDNRNLTIKNKTTGDTTECPTNWDKDSLYKYEFAVEADTSYEISVSSNGALIYAVEFNGSINASDRVATDEFKFVPTGTQFDIDDVVFDTANVSGVATAWDNCGVQRNVELADITFTVKNSSDVAVTGQITTPGAYTVTAAYDGKEVTYDIVIEDKNAVITEVQVDSSAATEKFYEGQAAFNADGIVVTATKGTVNISLTTEDYTVKLYKGTEEVTAFSTTGEYTVRVYANDTDVYGTYTINFYQVTNTVITSGNTATVKVGITSFNSCATAKLVYADDTTKDVTDSITEKYYEDVDCTIEKANPFAADGTVYLKLSVTGASKVITITVADIAATAYTYDSSTNTTDPAVTNGIDGTTWTATSATTTATIDGKALVKLDLTNNVTLNLTTAANMIDLTLTGGTGGSNSASDYLKIEFLDADGNVIDTVVGTTVTQKKIGDITYKAYDNANTFTFTSATACKSIRFTCTTSGKSVGIATAAINAYTLSS